MRLILNRRYRGKIEKIPLPVQSGTLTYNGKAQSPAWSGYDATKMTMGGVVSSVNAGTFTATFTPKRGYCWEDGGRDAKNVSWRIGKATPRLSLGKTTFNVGKKDPLTDSTAVSCISDGTPIISITGNINGKLERVETISNGVIAYVSGNMQDTMKITISVTGKTLSVVSENKNVIITLSCEIYFKASANCNASNTCSFTVHKAGQAVGA